MKIEFDLTGTDRKALIRAISKITAAKTVYKFMSTYAYQIGSYTVARDGSLEFDDHADSEEIETLLEKLEQKGFHAEPDAAQAAEDAPSEENIRTCGKRHSGRKQRAYGQHSARQGECRPPYQSA